MKFVLFLILAVFIAGCDPGCLTSFNSPSNKEKLADEVTNQAFLQLKIERELYPFGFNGRITDQIKVLGLSFHYYKEVDIAQARELLMTAGTLFLNKINSNEQIRSYLENYPFKPENIRIEIFFLNPNGSLPDPDKLIVVTMNDGILRYKVTSHETKRLTKVYEEKFEEAKMKLNTLAGL